MTDYYYYVDDDGDDPPPDREQPIRFDPTRASDAGNFDRARRHSLLVRSLKLVLPILAVGGIAGFLWTMRSGPEPVESSVTMAGVDVETRSVTMDLPRISGFEGTRRSYELEAERAVQDLSDPNLMRLETLKARFGMGNGVTATVHATRGVYNSSGKGLVLSDGVTLRTSNGYDGTFEEAEVDINKGTLVSSRPVTLGGKEGTIQANAMTITERGKRIVFSGGVVVTYNPPAERAPIRDVAPAAEAAPAAAVPPDTAAESAT